MLSENLAAIVEAVGETLIKVAPYLAVAAIVFTVLSSRFACNPGRPWWRSPELVTDLAYWFFIPVFTRFLRIGLMVVGAVYLFGIRGPDAIIAFYDNGHGPLAQLPFWLQTVMYLVVSDLLLYWSHRLFHGAKLWKFHAVHHSSEEVNWLSAARFHPVNLSLGTVIVDVALLIAGIAPAVLGILSPLSVAMSVFVHANVNWSLGPFKYVIAGPVFHRWHHTAPDRGGSKNFAATFPIFDIIFGTFYMPAGELPDKYGVEDPNFPRSFVGQMVYPFRS